MDQVLFPQHSSERGSARMFKFGRKLMWASCLCTMVISLQFLTQPADGVPLLATSLGECKPVKTAKSQLDCCLPAPSNTPKRFQLPRNRFLRERKPAHVLCKDLAYVKKYNEAYRRLKALPVENRMNFETQWKTHCAFCVGAYLPRTIGPNSTDVPGLHRLQVHYSWLFLPWHRMLLYFHERILGKLINDDTFALPFWNWDNHKHNGGQIPSFFLPGFPVDNSAIVNPNRNRNHFPPQFLPLNYRPLLEFDPVRLNMTKEEIIDENLSILYNHVVMRISPTQFLGGPYFLTNSSGGFVTNSSGAPLTESPREAGGAETLHDVAHDWVGLKDDPAHPDNDDMGTFLFSGKDPLFYTHHTNMDRIWNVWKTLPDKIVPGRNRKDHTVTDFLDSEMTFYDENGEMVIVKLKDTLDSTKLGYKYTDMTHSDRQWIEHKSKASAPASTVTDETMETIDYPEVDPNANNTISDTPTCFKVQRRPPNENDLRGTEVKDIKELAEEVVMEGLKVPHMSYVRLDAFIDNPAAGRLTDVDQSDYLGTFIHLPAGVVETTTGVVNEEDLYQTHNVRFCIVRALARLGITDYTTPITITIVPSMKNTTLSFKNLRQDFQ